jgi:hypothetical protein
MNTPLITDISHRASITPEPAAGFMTEADTLLVLCCQLAGARRAGIFRISDEGGRLDVGYRMSSQLGLVLLPQLDLRHGFPLLQSVVLGLENHQCLVLQLAMPALHGRSLVVLFEAGAAVTSQAVGRLEGAFHAWWHRPALTCGTHNLLHVCSACQDIQMADGGWAGWEAVLRQKLGLEISHTFCPSCFIELYGNVSPGSAGASR